MNSSSARIRGLGASLALVAFIAGVPAVLVAIAAVPDPGAFAWSRLTAPDDGTLALQVVTAVCWIAWAIFTCQLAASIAAQVRGRHTPRLPGLRGPQVAADRLVAAAALLFVAVPAVSAVLPQPRAHAVVATRLPQAPAVAHDDTVRVAGRTAASSAPASAPGHETHQRTETYTETYTEAYTVKRGDSLWRIAQERLGDGTRYVELVDLNHAVLEGRPDFLLPGTVLKVPVTNAPADEPANEPADGPAGESYVVQPGDTLTEIAEEKLGDADAYPRIVDASRGTLQSDGAHLTDPDLIRPGWRLTIPTPARSGGRNGEHGGAPQRAPQPAVPPAGLGPTPPPSTGPATVGPAHPDPTPDVNPDVSPSADADADAGGGVAAPGWLLPGLAGTGAVFGACLWLSLRGKRRTQLRFRRPGTILPATPEKLVPVEKTAHVTASLIAPRIEELDNALRHLDPLPRLMTVWLSEQHITLTLAEPADLPEPWTGAGAEWQIALYDVPPSPGHSFPPYPLLVSLGQDPGGAFVFVNLEELRTITVTGDPEQKSSLARHLAAELAVNPWSALTTVDILGLGTDLASFNLGRIRTHPAGDADFITHLVRDLAVRDPRLEPEDFHAAIIATTAPTATRSPAPTTAWSEDDIAALRHTIHAQPGRSSAALIDLAGTPEDIDVSMELTVDGRLRIAALGLDILAAGLSREEARACAALLDLTLDTEPVPIPDHSDSAASDSVVYDSAGALAEDLVEPRPPGPAGEKSLLPLEPAVYVEAAATTLEDVEALAPLAAPQAQDRVEKADPLLDEDLARWESPTMSATKLTLLGPVNARTTGDTKATAHRRPFYIELLAYLTLHPLGVTAVEIADAFGLRLERVRVDMSTLRRWLGEDPRTGQRYLPNAEAAPDSTEPARYKLHGVLCDLDLFRRLRARGQARGAEGIDDLAAALRLVTGEPFTNLREGHWAWLLDGDRWDHIMTSAIVDTAHILTTHALASNDPGHARQALWSARIAYSAAPYDEIAQLDIIAAQKAADGAHDVTTELRSKILNRRDDDLPPVHLPPRTDTIIGGKNWQPTRSRHAR